MNDFQSNRDDLIPHDDLDRALRAWHEENASRARAGRDALLARLGSHERRVPTLAVSRERHTRPRLTLPGFFLSPRIRAAASLTLVAFLAILLLPRTAREAKASIIQVADGGKLEARDENGNLLGPVPLQHTDVDVNIAGLFTRVTVRQQYANPYDTKIEAVYTFPLSHRAAVDRMRMTIGEDRIVEGEVKEREEARQIYEQAKAANHVAALLEQERPNIFTQSIANIEPGEKIEIEISYIETVESKDGEFTFAFPMTVAPRYIPGSSTVSPALVPAELDPRAGVVLMGPAQIELGTPALGAGSHGSESRATTQIVGAGQIEAMLSAATPIDQPDPLWWGVDQETGQIKFAPALAQFMVTYCGGSSETGIILTDGTGHIGGRWFYTDPKIAKTQGPGFSQNTNQVPDASRITPMPVKPPTRAGHDISVRVTIDTGGPAIEQIESELHEIEIIHTPEAPEARSEERSDDDRDRTSNDQKSRARIQLTNQKEIPNRDFVLKWRQTDDTIEEATFAHADARGGFFTLVLAPPRRVEAEMIRPRELIFVLDTSGSMSGLPIEKAKSVLVRAIERMREGDTFNIITFAGHTDILWEQPWPNTEANREEALGWVNAQQGSGGTEMMTAIEAALNPRRGETDRALSIAELADLPADGRDVRIHVPHDSIKPGEAWSKTAYGTLIVRDDLEIKWTCPSFVLRDWHEKENGFTARGNWNTQNGERVFAMRAIEDESSEPMRIVMFLTDGEVGNDMAIIDAVKKYAKTTRVFSFGIGNSVNRYLLVNMAHAARGEVEFVTQQSDPDEAVERFVTRIDAPILTDIELEFSKGLAVSDLLPVNPAGLIPDLYDRKPLIIHGRFDPESDATGTATIRGRTNLGAYERTIDLDLRGRAQHDQIATLWARAKVDQLMNSDLTGVQLGNAPQELRDQIVALGVAHQIMSQFTSFVAVEKSRVTIDGVPMLVTVPIELPSDARWEGYFGSTGDVRDDVIELTMRQLDLGISLSPLPEVADASADAPDEPAGNTPLQMLSSQEAMALRRQERRESGSREAAARQEQIRQNLLRVRELQLERRYEEALQVTDQILFLAPDNPTALLLRDVIETAEMWQPYVADERHREFSYIYELEENRKSNERYRLRFGDDDPAYRLKIDEPLNEIRHLARATLNDPNAAGFRFGIEGQAQAQFVDQNRVPMTNVLGPGPRSTAGLLTYPEDWPSLSTRHLTPDKNLTPILGDIPLASNYWMTSAGVTEQSIKLYSTSSAAAAKELAGYYERTPIATPVLERLDEEDEVIRTQLQLLWGGEDSTEGLDSAGKNPFVAYLPGEVSIHGNFLTKDKVIRTRLPLLWGADAADEDVSSDHSTRTDPWDRREFQESPDDLGEVAEPQPGDPLDWLRERIEHLAKLSDDQLQGPRLFYIFEPAGAFYRERIIIAIVRFIEMGEIDIAKRLVAWLIEIDSSCELATQLQTMLADETLGEEERNEQARALAGRARGTIEDAIRKSIIAQTLVQRVEESLLARLNAADQDAAESLRVTILVDDATGKIQKILRERGFTISGANETAGLIVGEATPADLRQIALLPDVRRIEPASLKPAK